MYSDKLLKKKAQVALVFLLCAAFILMPLSASAGNLKNGYWGNTTHNMHVNRNDNITIAYVNDAGDLEWENIAYCFNKNRGYPQGAYDGSTFSNEYETLDTQDDATWKSLSENPNYAGDMKDVLTKVVFIGYPYDSNDGNNAIKTILKEDCQVDDEYIDDVFRTATQKAVWHVTDGRDFKVPSNGSIPTGNTSAQVSEYVAKIIFERAVGFTGNTGLETKLWKWQGVNNRNQHLLDTGYTVNPAQPAVTTGTLTITKTIEGDATPEDAENAVKFKVTSPDGTTTEYTLADFTLTNGIYTLEITDAQVGDYTIEETAYEIEDTSCTITCAIDGAAAVETTQTTATVTAAGTTMADFKGKYTKKPADPNTGGNTNPSDPNTGGNTNPATGNNSNTANGNDKTNSDDKNETLAKTTTTNKADNAPSDKTTTSEKKTNPLTGDNIMFTLIATLALIVSSSVILLSRYKKNTYQPKHGRLNH